MSYFDKIFFKTFLFLALACFGVSSAFSSTEFVYYSSNATQFCSTDRSSVCAKQNSSTSNRSYTHNGSSSISGDFLICFYNQIQFDYNGPGQNEVSTQSTMGGVVLKKTCEAGETFKLTGCTAACVPDPCNSLKDTEESAIVSCGSASCPSGSVFQCSGGSCACSGGNKALFIAQPLPITSINGCSAVLKPQTIVPNSGKVKLSAAGSSSTGGYCTATFTHQGVSTPQTDTPTNLVSLAFTGADYPDANGDCSDPAKPIKSTLYGQTVCYPNDGGGNGCPVQGEKPNSNGVCVGPDDPTYPKDDTTDPTKPDPKTSCEAGEIRNNSGKCVPYADATKCEVGQIRDNLGNCSADPKSNSCPQGTVKNKTTGECSADPRGTGCAVGLPDKLGMCPDGSASCAVGKIRNASGACVGNNPDSPDGTGCKDGSTPNASGVCADGSASCPVGKVRGSDGKCALDTAESDTSGTASSDCDVAPECGGDPLQCASLEQIWRTGCEQIKAMSEISPEDADKMAAAAVFSQSQLDAAQADIDAQADGFFSEFETKANAVGSSGGCINDVSVSVMGHSMVIPFSQACDFFKFLRILVLFSAYMLAARILFGGVT